jgi:hypothetical protein
MTEKPTVREKCDCGAPLTQCSSCAVADYQAAHYDCTICCPPTVREDAAPRVEKCPHCHEGINSTDLGGNDRCFHCSECNYIACMWTETERREVVAALTSEIAQLRQERNNDWRIWECRIGKAREVAEARIAQLRQELSAEREKHDEEAYNGMKAAKEAAEAKVQALQLAAKEFNQAWKELTGRDYEPVQHLLTENNRVQNKL